MIAFGFNLLRISIIIFFLFSVSSAQAGTIVSAKKCLKGGKYPSDCVNIKVKNKSCSVKTTSKSPAQIGNSKFAGQFSFPELKVKRKKFHGSIVSYSAGREVDGNIRKFRTLGKGRFIGEWQGILSERVSRGAPVKVNIRNFYYYVKSSSTQHYLEYHCKL